MLKMIKILDKNIMIKNIMIKNMIIKNMMIMNMMIMDMMIHLIIQVPPASARVAVRTVMLTRHFLSRRTTANLLHIKEDIFL